MPGVDGTGPAGVGPMTGGGRGSCASPSPGAAAPFFRRGFSGRGGGRGRRNWFYATGLTGWQRAASGFRAFGRTGAPIGAGSYGPVWTAQEEKEVLKHHVEFLKSQLNELQNRIATLEKEES
ncbi:MAG TPA: DUF5320 domain-containing protein [Syntrophales bacterium]|nr:DUF5320 domain-containing protein [Syntrophales bacterium]